MQRSTLASWMLIAITGWGLMVQPANAGDNKSGSKAGSTARSNNGVIFDSQWTIVIRPAVRAATVPAPAPEPAAEISPATYQEEAPAPAPESVVAPQPETQAARTIGPELPPQMQPQPAAELPSGPPRMTYAEAYAAVPFSRSEYEGNPVYRHQAALELMFGVLRPTTLVQNYTPRASRYPDSYQIPYSRSDTEHINIRHIGRNYGNGFTYPFRVNSNW